jgi:hypothetical protein
MSKLTDFYKKAEGDDKLKIALLQVMSKSQKAFIGEVAKCAAGIAVLEAAQKAVGETGKAAIIRIAKAAGVELTAADFSEKRELSDDDLAAVTGGTGESSWLIGDLWDLS